MDKAKYIDNCYNTGTVSSGRGITGSSSLASVTNCVYLADSSESYMTSAGFVNALNGVVGNSANKSYGCKTWIQN